jgi:transglutaminase-like putative cysteine protease/phosphatidylserine synthase
MSAAAHAGVSQFRGAPPALRESAPDTPAPRAVRAGGPVLPLGASRGAAFIALALFGALHWMAMLEPVAPERAWYGVLCGAVAMLALLGAERIPSPSLRALAATAVGVGVVALAFLAGGVADELLRPDRWGELAAGIGRGIEAIPGARVPYRGIDEWTRTVIPLGGTVLTALAALAAFWPRRGARLGFPLAALLALVTLYAVPAVALDFDGEFLRGAVLTLLVIAFLRLERLRIPEAPAAGALAAATAVLALLVAPALDRDTPWWDYETWALSTAASRSTTFSWEHSYGPLDWPRDGREMLRVKARQPAYWKAQNLDRFDGQRWRQEKFGSREAPGNELPGVESNLRRWTQRIEVNVRNLRSRTFVTAGIPVSPPEMPRRAAIPGGAPGIYVSSRTLRRGDTYSVLAYTPKPSERELAAASGPYERDLVSMRSIQFEEAAGTSETRITFPEWGAIGVRVSATVQDFVPGSPVQELDAEELMERSDLRRTWALSQRLKRGASTPFDYVQAVEAYLADGYRYTESPPRAAETLEGFLFEAKSGYCQQYSGAMALLLRMGGVPARVGTGFTSGSLDRKSREYVVRDLDAHSWVEAWFPNYGWVTFDPTPSSAPPRSQDRETGAAAIGDAPDLGGGAGDPRSGQAAGDGGTPWALLALLGALATGLVALVVRLVRRRGRLSPLLELERALRRARRAPAPGATLRGLETSFASPAAAGYVRALRDERYGAYADPPTRAQRRGLRSELGRGRGPLGRLRAWWALPPWPPARRSR